MILYRFEHPASGKGPFQHDAHPKVGYATCPETQRCPADGPGVIDDVGVFPDAVHRVACTSLEQLRSWFAPHHTKLLEEQDYVLRKVRAEPGTYHTGMRQALYDTRYASVEESLPPAALYA